MNDIRIAFFDVDGTLSNMKTGRISAKTLECLHRLQARGVRICIATGRGPCLVPQLGDVRADVFLTCSGALCRTCCRLHRWYIPDLQHTCPGRYYL